MSGQKGTDLNSALGTEACQPLREHLHDADPACLQCRLYDRLRVAVLRIDIRLVVQEYFHNVAVTAGGGGPWSTCFDDYPPP